jgi:hypothetical protein
MCSRTNHLTRPLHLSTPGPLKDTNIPSRERLVERHRKRCQGILRLLPNLPDIETRQSPPLWAAGNARRTH